MHNPHPPRAPFRVAPYLFARVALIAAVLPALAVPAQAEPGDRHAWHASSTGWRDATSGQWLFPDPWHATLVAHLQGESAPGTAPQAESALQAAMDAALTLASAPGAPWGTVSRTNGDAVATVAYSVDPDFWSQPPDGASGPAGLSIGVTVSGWAAYPSAGLEAQDLSDQPPARLSPSEWSGPAPALVVLQLDGVGVEAPVVVRSDGGSIGARTPLSPGRWSIVVPISTGQRAIVTVSGNRPSSQARLVVTMPRAASWRIRSTTSGTILLNSPETEVTAPPEAEGWQLEAEGVAGVTHVVAAAPGWEAASAPYRLRSLIVAEPPPGSPPLVLLAADPVRGSDPLRTTLRWIAAGSTSTILQAINPELAAREVPAIGSLDLELPWVLRSTREAARVASASVHGSNASGGAVASVFLAVDPIPTVIALEEVPPAP